MEAQALVAPGQGVMLGYDLNVVLDPRRVAVRPVRDAVEPRPLQAAVLRGRRPPATRALLAAAIEVGRRERHGAYGYPHLALGCCQA